MHSVAATTAPPASAGTATTGTGPARRSVLLFGSAAAAVAVPIAGLALVTRSSATDDPAAARAGGIISSGQVRPALASFTDVPADHPAVEAIAWAHGTGVQPGLEDGTYAPNSEVTRGELAAALHRLAGAPVIDVDATPTLLTDVPSDPDHAAAVLWLHGRGVIWGDAELRVHPDAPATCAEGAVILTDLLAPALAGAVVDAAPALQAVLSVLGSSHTVGSGDSSATRGVAGLDGEALSAVDPDAPLTRAHLALALHQVEITLAS